MRRLARCLSSLSLSTPDGIKMIGKRRLKQGWKWMTTDNNENAILCRVLAGNIEKQKDTVSSRVVDDLAENCE